MTTASVKRSFLSVVVAALAFAPFAANAASSASPRHNPFQGVAVSGTSADGNVFNGTMDVVGFVNDNGVVKAIGNLNGTVTSAAGAAQQVANAVVLVPVKTPAAAAAQGIGGAEVSRQLSAAPQAAAAASCTILHLDLGPLDLSLLGLNVHLNEVVLDVTAVPGAGNLLGNLLCGVANLLNGVNLGGLLGASLTNTLTTLLNNILALL